MEPRKQNNGLLSSIAQPQVEPKPHHFNGAVEAKYRYIKQRCAAAGGAEDASF
jgi:hypothetical protein